MNKVGLLKRIKLKSSRFWNYIAFNGNQLNIVFPIRNMRILPSRVSNYSEFGTGTRLGTGIRIDQLFEQSRQGFKLQ